MQKKLQNLEIQSSNQDFWIDKNIAFKTLKSIKYIKNKIDFINQIDEQYELLKIHLDILKSDQTL